MEENLLNNSSLSQKNLSEVMSNNSQEKMENISQIESEYGDEYKSVESFDMLGEYKAKLAETPEPDNQNWKDDFLENGVDIHQGFLKQFEKNWKKVKIINNIIDRKSCMPHHNQYEQVEDPNDGNNKSMCSVNTNRQSMIFGDSMILDEGDREFVADVKNIAKMKNQIITKEQIKNVKETVTDKVQELKKLQPMIYEKDLANKKLEQMEKVMEQLGGIGMEDGDSLLVRSNS